jgi:hypothetical protein
LETVECRDGEIKTILMELGRDFGDVEVNEVETTEMELGGDHRDVEIE